MRTEAAARKQSAEAPRWSEVAIRVPVADAERLGALLIDAGSAGVITGVHELARGARRRVYETVRGFFPAGDPVRARLAVHAALNRLAAASGGGPGARRARLRVTWLDLDARLWEMDWRAHFQPVRAGRTLVVVPPWDRAPHPGRRRVVIHPGMAFGTGQHATTLGCLEAIETLTAAPPARALDLGTGTGVLAIALARRGVRMVDAIDTDPQAVAAARANVRRNRLAGRVRITATPLAAAPRPRVRRGARPARPGRRYPLIVANVYVDALVALEPVLARRVAPGGHLVTSGVLRAQQGRLRRAYAAARWRLVRARRRGAWVTSVFARRPDPAAPVRRAPRRRVRG